MLFIFMMVVEFDDDGSLIKTTFDGVLSLLGLMSETANVLAAPATTTDLTFCRRPRIMAISEKVSAGYVRPMPNGAKHAITCWAVACLS